MKMLPGVGLAFPSGEQGHDVLSLQTQAHPPPHRPVLPEVPALTTTTHSLETDAFSLQAPNFDISGADLSSSIKSEKKRSQRSYLCGKCGMKKKGHICGVIVTTSVKESPVIIPKFVSSLISKAHKPSPIRPIVRIPVNRPAMRPSQRMLTWRTHNFKWFVPGFQRQHSRQAVLFENASRPTHTDSILPAQETRQGIPFPNRNSFGHNSTLQLAHADSLVGHHAFGSGNDFARFGHAPFPSAGYAPPVESQQLVPPSMDFEASSTSVWLLRQKYGEPLRPEATMNSWGAPQAGMVPDR